MSLFNLQSSEGEDEGAAHGSCCLWPWSQPCHDAWLQSWCNIQQECLGSSMPLLVLWTLSSCGDPSWLWKLNGSDAGGCEWGCPGPLALMHHSVMALAINCQPSHRLNMLALSWACLPTQLMAPNSVNMASCASPRLIPSPRDCLL